MQDSKIPSKEDIVKEAQKYVDIDPAISYAKGYAAAIRDLSPYLVDYYKSKIEKLIK